MPRFGLVVAITLLFLAGCAPSAAPKMHDLYVYGVENARFSYFYGEPTQLTYAGVTLALTAPEPGAARTLQPFEASGTLLADGKGFLREALTPLDVPPVTVSRIPFTTDLQVAVGSNVSEVIYYDGQSFLRLLLAGEAGTVQRVVPKPRLNLLRGLGELTTAEADALANALRSRGGAFALALLPTVDLPAHAVDGLTEQRRTGVYVQRDIAVDQSAVAAAPEELAWEVVAQGNQAVGFTAASYRMITSQDQLISLWQQAYGSQLTVPPVPNFDFRRETVVALFVGAKSTGGYGVQVLDAREEQGELYLDVSFTEPGPGAITTQALTSPWLIVRVQRGGYSAAWLRDSASGNLVGVARVNQ